MLVLPRLTLLALLAGPALPCQDSTFVTKWTVWEGGLAATVKVVAPGPLDRWTVQLDFNKEFTKMMFFQAVSSSSLGATFNVTNESFNGQKKAGDVIGFSLLGDYKNGDAAQPISLQKITFNGKQLCQAA